MGTYETKSRLVQRLLVHRMDRREVPEAERAPAEQAPAKKSAWVREARAGRPLALQQSLARALQGTKEAVPKQLVAWVQANHKALATANAETLRSLGRAAEKVEGGRGVECRVPAALSAASLAVEEGASPAVRDLTFLAMTGADGKQLRAWDGGLEPEKLKGEDLEAFVRILKDNYWVNGVPTDKGATALYEKFAKLLPASARERIANSDYRY